MHRYNDGSGTAIMCPPHFLMKLLEGNEFIAVNGKQKYTQMCVCVCPQHDTKVEMPENCT